MKYHQFSGFFLTFLILGQFMAIDTLGQADSIIVLPIRIGRLIEKDLRTKDALDTLVSIQEEHIQGLLKLVSGKDAELALHVEMEKQLNAVIRDKSEKEIASADLCAVNIKTAKKRGRREGFGGVILLGIIIWIATR